MTPTIFEWPPRPFGRSYWIIPGKLLAGFLPSSADAIVRRNNLRNLLKCGIRWIINLMEPDETNYQKAPFLPYEEEFLGLAALENLTGKCLRFPIKDCSVTTPERMVTILNTIDQCLVEENPVYVHCWGGRGRTGTVIGCWLARHGIASGEDVLKKIAELRQAQDQSADLPAPETPEQRKMVRTWREDSPE